MSRDPRSSDEAFLLARRMAALDTEASVQYLRRVERVPETETCPRWVACPCRSVAKDPSHSGACQRVFGQGVYCCNCGALL